jgi:hypothetical protein
MDKHKKGEISKTEFIAGFLKVYLSDLPTKIRLTFDM